MRVRRHPVLGVVGGALVGLGLGLLFVFVGLVPLGGWTLVVLVGGFMILGVVYAMAWPAPTPPPRPRSEPPPGPPPA